MIQRVSSEDATLVVSLEKRLSTNCLPGGSEPFGGALIARPVFPYLGGPAKWPGYTYCAQLTKSLC